MSIFKKIELLNKKFIYFLIKLLYKNEIINIPIEAAKIKRVLLFRYDVLGDMVVTTPVFDLLHKIIPDVEIYVLASSKNAILIKDDRRITKIIEFNRKFGELFRIIPALRKVKYDLILPWVFSSKTLPGLLCLIIGGKKSIKATNYHIERHELYAHLFNIQINLTQFRGRITMAEYQLRMICELFGFPFNEKLVNYSLPIPDEKLEKARQYYLSLGKGKNIIFNISSREAFTQWSSENISLLIEKILMKYPEVRIIISSSPEDKNLAELICNKPGEMLKLYSSTQNIWEIIALINYCDMVITPDTGIIHIASMCKKPLLCLYSSINNKDCEWDPYGVPFKKILSKDNTPISTITVDEAFEGFCEIYSECFNK